MVVRGGGGVRKRDGPLGVLVLRMLLRMLLMLLVRILRLGAGVTDLGFKRGK